MPTITVLYDCPWKADYINWSDYPEVYESNPWACSNDVELTQLGTTDEEIRIIIFSLKSFSLLDIVYL